MVSARRLTEIDLPPDVFAVVMATGIVSVAARDHGYRRIDLAFTALAVAAFLALLTGLFLRVVARPASAFGEVRDPDVALRLFTFVAACAVLSTRLSEHVVVVDAIDAVAALAWLILVPIAARDVCSRPRADLRDHAHGAWLLASVATSGLAIAAADRVTDHAWSGWLVISALAWALAILLYLAVAWLIAWRSMTGPFRPDEVTPDSWILMGALAISTLAGDRLLGNGRRLGSWHWLLDVAHPVTLVLWIIASLWIPVLLYAEVWRIDHRSGSLKFAGVWWSAVFPLGMYATATYATAVQLNMPSLVTISLVFFWNAATVWLLVASGWLHSLLRRHAVRPTARSG